MVVMRSSAFSAQSLEPQQSSTHHSAAAAAAFQQHCQRSAQEAGPPLLSSDVDDSCVDDSCVQKITVRGSIASDLTSGVSSSFANAMLVGPGNLSEKSSTLQ